MSAMHTVHTEHIHLNRNERWPCPVHVFNFNMFTVFRHQSVSDKCTKWIDLSQVQTLPPAQTHIGPLRGICWKSVATNVYKWPNVFRKTKIIVILNIRIWLTARAPFTKNPSNHGMQLKFGFFKGFHLHTHTFGFVECSYTSQINKSCHNFTQ